MTVTPTGQPVISGTPRRGEVLTTSDGTWVYDLDYLTYTYQWLRCDAAGQNCSAIAGATADHITLSSADVGHTLRSQVTATEHAYPNPTPPSDPGPIAGQGYSLVFEDDFDTLDTDTWRLGIWYIPESPANYSVSSSVLSIYNHPSERKQRDLMTRTRAFQYGYFEMRARYTRNTDAWASIWMMSDNWIRTGNCSSLKISEIDILETFHNLESPTTWRSHSSTIHRNTSGACGMADSFRPNWTNDSGHEMADNWRTYAGWWTPTSVKTYVDETLCKTHPVWDTTNQPQRLMLAMWSHAYAAELTLEVDWVRVWQQ